MIKRIFERVHNIKVDNSLNIFVSPVQSLIMSVNKIENGIIKGKNNDLRLEEILKEDLVEFREGIYINQYLAPFFYHAVVFPCDGQVISNLHYLGEKDYPIMSNPNMAEKENERLTSLIKTEYGFNICLVMIGSIIPLYNKKIGIEAGYKLKENYKRGDYFGKFKWGSTVDLIFPKDVVDITVKKWRYKGIGKKIAKVK